MKLVTENCVLITDEKSAIIRSITLNMLYQIPNYQMWYKNSKNNEPYDTIQKIVSKILEESEFFKV